MRAVLCLSLFPHDGRKRTITTWLEQKWGRKCQTFQKSRRGIAQWWKILETKQPRKMQKAATDLKSSVHKSSHKQPWGLTVSLLSYTASIPKGRYFSCPEDIRPAVNWLNRKGHDVWQLQAEALWDMCSPCSFFPSVQGWPRSWEPAASAACWSEDAQEQSHGWPGLGMAWRESDPSQCGLACANWAQHVNPGLAMASHQLSFLFACW